jgi:hypothetical protein
MSNRFSGSPTRIRYQRYATTGPPQTTSRSSRVRRSSSRDRPTSPPSAVASRSTNPPAGVTRAAPCPVSVRDLDQFGMCPPAPRGCPVPSARSRRASPGRSISPGGRRADHLVRRTSICAQSRPGSRGRNAAESGFTRLRHRRHPFGPLPLTVGHAR